jgi:hypothetical protein
MAMLFLVAGCSRTQIDFAEYLLPTKNLIVETRYGEVHDKATYIINGNVVTETRETLEPASLKGVTMKKWEIEEDGIYLTVKNFLTGEVEKRKYANREVFIREGTILNINGGDYSVLGVDQTLDSVIGKLYPCIVVKKTSKRGYEKNSYCKGYGEIQGEMKYGKDEASVEKVISIK